MARNSLVASYPLGSFPEGESAPEYIDSRCVRLEISLSFCAMTSAHPLSCPPMLPTTPARAAAMPSRSAFLPTTAASSFLRM